MPTVSLLVAKVATPDEFRLPEPRRVVPSRKFTVPVGSTDGTPVMVAVNVRVAPDAAVLTEDLRAIAGVAWVTVTMTAAEVTVR